ncbi:hypothetical protein [Thioalkalivibrio sp. HK1]|uniref:hypothetical protein n=1 Tax=Thioalkalivibrio sp. HK1 TaxID=1469245 RepID=UPI0012DFAA6C|nr:hypothetical protein [Thioalkalivibrio sp. HK1]
MDQALVSAHPSLPSATEDRTTDAFDLLVEGIDRRRSSPMDQALVSAHPSLPSATEDRTTDASPTDPFP